MSRLIVGVGARDRGDDGAGLEVAARLEDAGATGIEFHDGEAASLLSMIEHHDDVVIVDATTSDRPVGSIVEFDVVAEPLPIGVCHSTHAFGVAAALELARTLGKLPSRTRVIGIEGGDFRFGRGLSPEVEQAVRFATEAPWEPLADLVRHVHAGPEAP